MVKTVRVVEVDSIFAAWREAKRTVCTMVNAVHEARAAALERIRAECGQDAEGVRLSVGDLTCREWIWWEGARIDNLREDSHWDFTLKAVREIARALERAADPEAWIQQWMSEQDK